MNDSRSGVRLRCSIITKIYEKTLKVGVTVGDSRSAVRLRCCIIIKIYEKILITKRIKSIWRYYIQILIY